jgi:hypothetical protein
MAERSLTVLPLDEPPRKKLYVLPFRLLEGLSRALKILLRRFNGHYPFKIRHEKSASEEAL